MILVVVVLACVVLLLLGFLAPRTSRRVQGSIDRRSGHAEHRLEDSDRTGSDRAEKTTQLVDKAVDASSSAGRRLRGDD